MKYRFHIHMTDEDYMEFNRFWQYQTPDGKKIVRLTRLLVFSIFWMAMGIVLVLEGFTLLTLIIDVALAITSVVYQLLLKSILNMSLDRRIKKLKKSGKNLYSPESIIEFYDDYFLESVEENQSKRMYSGVERVIVAEGKTIYIREGLASAYIIPYSCFESEEQYREFVAFVKVKFAKVDCY